VPYFSSIELTSSTPFIDFHFGKDPADYTARIIQTEANALEVGAGRAVCHSASTEVCVLVASHMRAVSIYTEVTVMRMHCGD
jgi:hypothetical protein